MPQKKSLGDRLKYYESQYNKSCIPLLASIARLDGRAFHQFTKGLNRPYDERLSRLMVESTIHLVKEFNAVLGYCQSDEISLIWLMEKWNSEILFDGNINKMNSILASSLSVFFNKHLESYLPEKKDKSPLFDCRVFQVPTHYEVSNYCIWREMDATRNSIQMAAHTYFSAKECHKKNCSDLQEMLYQKGINWNNYPSHFKRGTYVRKVTCEQSLNDDNLKNLPEKHHAKIDKSIKFNRTVVQESSFPLLKTIANREEVLLFGKEPILKKDKE